MFGLSFTFVHMGGVLCWSLWGHSPRCSLPSEADSHQLRQHAGCLAPAYSWIQPTGSASPRRAGWRPGQARDRPVSFRAQSPHLPVFLNHLPRKLISPFLDFGDHSLSPFETEMITALFFTNSILGVSPSPYPYFCKWSFW